MATITELVVGNDNFDILEAAVVAAGLDGALADPAATLTAFAPTDAAFVGLANALGFEGSDESGALAYLLDALTLLSGGSDPIPLLADILKYHVAGEEITATELAGLTQITTLLGTTLTVNSSALVDADPDTANANVVTPDIAADNGVVHVIDNVLLPVDALADGVDLVIGDDGRDVIARNRGVDLIDGNGGRDQLFSGMANDVVLGGDGDDRINGGSGHDILNGEADDDRIKGGRGDDTITGGTGDDRLKGEKGADVFVFAPAEGEDNGRDLIEDFRIGQDKIDLSAYGIASFDDLSIRDGKGRRFIIELDDGTDIIVKTHGRGKELDADDFLFA